jgi:hypothetical protein
VDVREGRGQPGLGPLEAGEQLARAIGRDVDQAGEAVDEGGEAGRTAGRGHQALAQARRRAHRRQRDGEGRQRLARGFDLGGEPRAELTL